MTEIERARRALAAAAKGEPHSAKDLAMALRMVAKCEHKDDHSSNCQARFKLSESQMRTARLIAQGLRTKDIANRLGISVAAAKGLTHQVMKKLCVESRTMVALVLGGSPPGDG